MSEAILIPPSALTRDQQRSRRPERARSRTLSVTKPHLSPQALDFAIANSDPAIQPMPRRPLTRGECLPGVGLRPCPWVSCKFHLWLDVTPAGNIMFNRLDVFVDELEKMGDTCALDVADRGGLQLEAVGDIMNVTRERIRQVEAVAVRKLEALPQVRRFIREIGSPAFEGSGRDAWEDAG